MRPARARGKRSGSSLAFPSVIDGGRLHIAGPTAAPASATQIYTSLRPHDNLAWLNSPHSLAKLHRNEPTLPEGRKALQANPAARTVLPFKGWILLQSAAGGISSRERTSCDLALAQLTGLKDNPFVSSGDERSI